VDSAKVLSTPSGEAAIVAAQNLRLVTLRQHTAATTSASSSVFSTVFGAESLRIQNNQLRHVK